MGSNCEDKMNFTCIICKHEFEQQRDLEVHILFTHNKYMAPCSTDVSQKEFFKDQRVVKHYKYLKRRIPEKIRYMEKKFFGSKMTIRPNGTHHVQMPCNKGELIKNMAEKIVIGINLSPKEAVLLHNITKYGLKDSFVSNCETLCSLISKFDVKKEEIKNRGILLEFNRR